MFDVLVYLVRHRERVVPKEELLGAIWPDVVVTDSSLMRAVSVIRSLLSNGAPTDLIQTFSRQGYRFIGEIDDTPPPPATDPEIARARAAATEGDWTESWRAFQNVSNPSMLQAADLEQWAHAALCLGQPNDAIAPSERAVAAHIQNADRVGAARVALSLTNIHFEARSLPVAKGWHRRAGAFLGDEPHETREHGWYLWLAARIAFAEGDMATCLEKAREAEALARRLEDPDVEALGFVYQAHIEIAIGEIRSGLIHLDEAGAAVLAGTVSPWVTGFVFCGVIWIHLDRGDLHRAGQWTDQFVRWSQRNTSFGFPGLCRLHRGEVLCAQGKLSAAETEIQRARELLAESARYAEGDACRVLGEIRLLRGDVDGAREAFRNAHELGWHALPGWALVHEEDGRFADAIKSLQRGLKFPNWADGQRRGILQAHLIRIAALAGKRTLARTALAELEAAPDLRNTAGSEAGYHRARAEVEFAAGRSEAAIDALRAALAVWLDAGSRINVAHTRLRLAQIFQAMGDREDAELEFAAAEKAFAAMGADPMVARCQAARKSLTTAPIRRQRKSKKGS